MTLNQQFYQTPRQSNNHYSTSNQYKTNNQNPNNTGGGGGGGYTRYTYVKNGKTYTYTTYSSNEFEGFGEEDLFQFINRKSSFNQKEYDRWKKILEKEEEARYQRQLKKQKTLSQFLFFLFIIPMVFYVWDVYYQMQQIKKMNNEEAKKYLRNHQSPYEEKRKKGE